jgi:hypothetical protein
MGVIVELQLQLTSAQHQPTVGLDGYGGAKSEFSLQTWQSSNGIRRACNLDDGD